MPPHPGERERGETGALKHVAGATLLADPQSALELLRRYG